MGLAMEMISGQATAPSSTLTAVTVASGNSLTVRNAAIGSDVRLIQAWGSNNAAGIMRIRSPKLHDNVQGIRWRIDAADAVPLLPYGAYQKLTPQDQLIMEVSGSAVGGQIEQAQFVNWYADLPGSAARLTNWADILPKIVNLVNVEVAITPGSAGGYSGAAALNSTFDLLQANTNYALLGGMVDVACAAVQVTGPDTANLGVGFPGYLKYRNDPADFFKRLNLALGIPTIPVINSANKSGTQVAIVQNQTGNAVNVTLVMAQLSS